MKRVKIGVMGSTLNLLSKEEQSRLRGVGEELGEAIAKENGIVITGACSGLPKLVADSARKHGGLTIGISPASSTGEHVDCYGMPEDPAEVVIHTGFGLKGRNVVNIRASDIVIIFGGSIGTLNEFTIAYDEGRVIGVLEGSGGVADGIREIVSMCDKPTRSKVIIERDPGKLLSACLQALKEGLPSAPVSLDI